MRVKTFYRALRFMSAVVLFFFVWTFGPIWQAVAFAATSRNDNARGQSAGSRRPNGAVAQKPEERFEKALEEIREKVGRVEEKAAKGEDDSAERETIKARKSEVDSLASELRNEFTETERKLKTAGLPKTILTRHSEFVANFEKNVKELRDNLDGIEAAKTKTGRKAKIEKARLHLEKTKPVRHHTPLTPDQLPNRNRKATNTVAPRLKEEEYKRDFPQRKSRSKTKLADNRLFYDLLAKAPQQKTILLAFNGPDSDIPASLSAQASTPQFAFVDSSPFIIALGADLPTSDDLASTPEIQVDSPLIRAKAQELGCSPVKLYEFTRNEINFTPTYGAIQGAEMCLQSKECNAVDTNSLLVALLRSCNIPARLNIGTIELPIEKVMNWADGFSDPATALNYLASGGIPVMGLRSGGKIYAARLETTWTRAFIDYIPSFGAVHKEGDTWIPLDAAYKQYTYTDGIDFQAAVPFNAQNLVDQIKATATINEQESYVTNVNASVIEAAQNEYNALLETYVTDNFPNATPGDILGKKDIIRKDQPILPASLPYKVVAAGVETSEIPEQLKHKITIQLTDTDNWGSAAFTYTTGLAQVAGKRVTVSYDPATAADQTTINNYAEQYATSIPAYLIQFVPVLRIEGAVVATGPAIGMGSSQNLTITVTSPMATEQVTHILSAGDYTAIGLNPSKISLDVLQNRVDKNDYSEPVGEMLHQTALSYWAEADAFNGVIAKTMRVNSLRHPSELTATAKVTVSYVWGVPTSATYESRTLDVKLDNQSVSAKSTDKTKAYYYMQQSGTNGSFLEGAIYDQLFGANIGDGVSAVTAMKLANEQGMPIYTIDSSNIATVLPKLQVTETVKTDVSNAVNAGLQVQIPQTNITKSGWTGVGYIILNKTDGSGAYRISGGLNGDVSSTPLNTVIPLPQVTISGTMAFVIGNIVSSSSAVVRMGAGLTVLKGLAIPVGAVLVDITFVILIAILIYAIVKSLTEKYPPEYREFRHYTSYVNLRLIQTSMRLLPSSSGDLGPAGVYVTDSVILDLQAPGDAAIVAFKLNMTGIIETYLDIAVNVSKVIMVNGKYRGFPDQYILYMPTPVWGYIPLDNDTAKVITWGPFSPLP